MSTAEGKTLMIEDFWNASPDFDILLDHLHAQYQRHHPGGRYTINNSEIILFRQRGHAHGRAD
ncbi:MAG: hypothetical protein R2911_45810 [Caldilineaceae bacterium]